MQIELAKNAGIIRIWLAALQQQLNMQRLGIANISCWRICNPLPYRLVVCLGLAKHAISQHIAQCKK
jgi:hypothetical protein